MSFSDSRDLMRSYPSRSIPRVPIGDGMNNSVAHLSSIVSSIGRGSHALSGCNMFASKREFDRNRHGINVRMAKHRSLWRFVNIAITADTSLTIGRRASCVSHQAQVWSLARCFLQAKPNGVAIAIHCQPISSGVSKQNDRITTQ